MCDEKTPVTLEGIAAVLAVVPALLGQAPEKARQSALADALGMLSRACVMAGGRKAPPGMEAESLCRPPSHGDAEGKAHAALAALLEPFRCAGESDHAGALSRLIAENKALKEDEAWVEQTVRLISTSGDISLTVKAGSNLPEAVGVLLEERKHLSTLLEESGFPSGFRGAYTLFARLQELVVAWREKHQSEVAQRMEDAAETMGDTIRDRLLAILFPGQPAPSLNLEDCLRDVDSRLNRNRPPLGNPPPYVVRDAALEEVERVATTMASNNTAAANCASTGNLAVTYRARAAAFREMASECHALKSKPTPQPSDNPGELQQAAPTWEPDSPTDLPDEEQPPRTPTPEQERELAERREAREEATRRLDALATSDVHDFGWALAQMRAGKKVRRPSILDGGRISVDAEMRMFLVHRIGYANRGFTPSSVDLLATDWELAE